MTIEFFTLHSSLFILHSSLFILHSSFFILHSSLFPLPSSQGVSFFTFLPFYFFTFKTSSVSHFFIIFARIIKTMRV